MKARTLVMAALAGLGLAAPAAAWAEVGFHLRNDTRLAQSCRLHRPHSTMTDRFVLRPGEAWNRPAQGGDSRRLVCDTGPAPLVSSLRPGYNYALILDPETGRIALQIVPLR
jgi:hypothetical protein